jgi:hypothetical protein
VVEDLLDHVLGNITVDEPGSQSMAPLMGSEMDGIAVLVAPDGDPDLRKGRLGRC